MRGTFIKRVRCGRHRLAAVGGAVVLVVSMFLIGGPGLSSASAAQNGGSINVVIINNEFLNLDPAHNENDVTDGQQMGLIYGGLFQQTASGGITGYMASGYKWNSNDTKLTISIRPGIKFTDGTPLDAAAVVWNIKRDLLPANACDCANSFEEVSTVKAVGGKVVITTKIPDPPLMEAFINNAPNDPASPTAVEKVIKQTGKDTAFGQHPVGAGPYMVKTFVPDSKVVLVKNPNFFIKGEPHIDQLTFTTTAVDQSAYSALESGGAQVVIGVTTVPIIKQAEKAEKVHIIKGTVASTLEMNSYKPPLNNPIAREAIEYAIDPQALLNINSPGFGQVVQDYIGPASPFYEKTVPGYKGYDLAKAKALVKQLGGHLTVQLQTLTSAANATAATALENQLAQAGITMTIKTEELTTMDNNLTPGNWQMVPGAAGGPDPDIGPQSLPTRFSSAGLYTCCKSSTLDKLINQTVEDVNPAQRLEAVHKAYAMIAKNDYVVPLYSTEGAVLYSPKIHGLTTVPSLINDVSWTQMTVGS